jgi:hypothetical protein
LRLARSNSSSGKRTVVLSLIVVTCVRPIDMSICLKRRVDSPCSGHHTSRLSCSMPRRARGEERAMMRDPGMIGRLGMAARILALRAERRRR